MLLSEGFITDEALSEAFSEHEQSGRRVAEILAERNQVKPEHVAMVLGKQHGIPYLPLSDFEIDSEIVQMISEDMARKYRMVPVDRTDNSLTVALADPANVFLLDNIRRSVGMEIIPLISTPGAKRMPRSVVVSISATYFSRRSHPMRSRRISALFSSRRATPVPTVPQPSMAMLTGFMRSLPQLVSVVV